MNLTTPQSAVDLQRTALSTMSKFADIFSRIIRQNQKPNIPSNYWYPSLLGFCDRRAVLRRAGVQSTPPEDRLLRLFWLGNAIHLSLQETVSKDESVKILGHELSYRDEEYKISGRLDTLALVDGIIEAVEWKSIRSDAFWKKSLPYSHHVLQVSPSLVFPVTCPICLDKLVCELCEGSKKILPQRARIVYWSKDDAEIKEFVITPTDSSAAEIKQLLRNLEKAYLEYVASATLPPPLQMVQVGVYKKKGKWGKKGDPIMKPNPLIKYCEYKGTGLCCGDK